MFGNAKKGEGEAFAWDDRRLSSFRRWSCCRVVLRQGGLQCYEQQHQTPGESLAETGVGWQSGRLSGARHSSNRLRHRRGGELWLHASKAKSKTDPNFEFQVDLTDVLLE
jgi:hypothetical protein